MYIQWCHPGANESSKGHDFPIHLISIASIYHWHYKSKAIHAVNLSLPLQIHTVDTLCLSKQCLYNVYWKTSFVNITNCRIPIIRFLLCESSSFSGTWFCKLSYLAIKVFKGYHQFTKFTTPHHRTPHYLGWHNYKRLL